MRLIIIIKNFRRNLNKFMLVLLILVIPVWKLSSISYRLSSELLSLSVFACVGVHSTSLIEFLCLLHSLLEARERWFLIVYIFHVCAPSYRRILFLKTCLVLSFEIRKIFFKKIIVLDIIKQIV